MKQVVLLVCVWWICVSSFAQFNCVLSLSTDKTTSLVFPAPIRHVDAGSKDVLVQKVAGLENLLFAKAGVVDFRPTNINVVTADGEVYSIDVVFEESPEVTVHYLQPQRREGQWMISFMGESMKWVDMKAYATGILDNPRRIWGVRNSKWGITASVNGIYVKDGLIFFQLLISNSSPINYDIGHLRFYIKDSKRMKRTAVQEIDLVPLCEAGNTGTVTPNNAIVTVFAFEKFTIPDAKHLVIELGEKNGGRRLRLKVGNKKLLHARILPYLN